METYKELGIGEGNCQPRSVYSTKPSFKNEDKVNVLHKKRLRESITGKPRNAKISF